MLEADPDTADIRLAERVASDMASAVSKPLLYQVCRIFREHRIKEPLTERQSDFEQAVAILVSAFQEVRQDERQRIF